MRYQVKLFASNDHDDLEIQIATWLRAEKPETIHHVRFVADGAEFSYCALFLFEARKKLFTRSRWKIKF